jgi:hypothetical protein
VPINDLISANVLASSVLFNHLDPQIEWMGNSDLYIDYITIEDEYHRSMRLLGVASPILQMLNRRLQDISHIGNLAFLYSFDEPRMGHFDTYKRVQNYIRDYCDIDKPMITAIDWTAHATAISSFAEIKQPRVNEGVRWIT